MGVDEECRDFRVVLDGARKFTVARSVTFYEQALVNAMRSSVGLHLSDASNVQFLQPSVSTFSGHSEGTYNSVSMPQRSTSVGSLAELSSSSELLKIS